MLATGLVNRAIRDALRDGAEAREARGILVVPHLESTETRVGDDPALYQAIYTIFRGLPERLSRGATLYVSTSDDIEGTMLTWDATEGKTDDSQDATVKDVMRAGPYGDLLELAVVGLEALCRARSEQWGAPAASNSPGLTGLELEPRLRRRVVFLIPPARSLDAAE